MTDPRRELLHLEVWGDPEGRAIQPGPLVDALASAVASGYPSGLAFAVVDRQGLLVAGYGGSACAIGDPVPIRRDTLFDLASLTKVVATVPLALVMCQRAHWSLQDPVAAWVPGFPHPDTTLWHLLTHTSGLVPHRAFYLTCRGATAIRKAVFEEVRASRPGDDVCYSDLNFILLGWALERCAGVPLDALFRQEIAGPLGMARTRFRPPPGVRRRTAATELDGDQRTGPGLVWGTVHDGNAFALGGVAGHAGLFGPVDELATFAGALLDPPSHPVLSEASIADMSARQAGHPPDVRGLGWRLEPTEWGSWPNDTYWHTGFTGTSLLVSPSRGLGVVLLMNGVHPHRRPDEQMAVRSRIHSIIAEVCQ
jgi:CubicO group peptidase (beta-lactamase class C family)